MRALLSLAAAVIAVTFLVSATQAQQAVQYFYCYVPNAATSTVYMTQTLPVGPVSERGKYGEEYAAYLRGEGLVSASARGYCTMRPTTGEIAVARQDLQSYCSECNGATRFTTAPWSRPGMQTVPEQKTAETAIQAVIPQQPKQTVPLAPEKAPELRLAVMGNDVTGEVLVVTGPNAEKAAEDAAANAFPTTGWQKLAMSEASGYGMALCVDGPPITFFVAEGKKTLADAAAEVLPQARAYAKQTGKQSYMCRHWHIKEAGYVEPAWESSVVGTVKGHLRAYLTCKAAESDCLKDAISRIASFAVRG
ncbi:MAG: hypothetical protein AB7I36_10780 [Rhodospirillaceae bacterium]